MGTSRFTKPFCYEILDFFLLITNNAVNISALCSYDFLAQTSKSESNGSKSINILRPLICNIKLFPKTVMLIFFPVNNI